MTKLLLNKVLEIGRHYNITAVVTAHLPSNGHETRRILNESSSITIFPHSASGKIKDMIEAHISLSCIYQRIPWDFSTKTAMMTIKKKNNNITNILP